MLDIEQLRADTPGVANVLHFNNAGAALMPQPVIHAMQQHLQHESLYGGYEAAAMATEQLARTYSAVAQLINASSDEIAILENATRAWTMAFYGIPFKEGDRILTSVSEYASNYIAYLQVKKRVNISVEVVPDDEHGQMDTHALKSMMDDRVRLISLAHIPSQGGLIQPAETIGKIARDYGAWYLLDACQSSGQLDLNVEKIGCHILSATGRKYLRGPRGIGFLYVSQEILQQIEPPLLDLHAATWISRDHYQLQANAKRFENWEANISAKIGLGVAVDYALQQGVPEIETRVRYLASKFREQLATIPGVHLQDRGQEKCGIVTFTTDNHSASAIKEALHQAQINTSVSPRTYAIIDFDSRGLDSLLRASVHYYNTESEIDRFCNTLANL